MVFDDGDYEQKKDTKPEPPRRQQRVKRRENVFIDADPCVDGEADSDERTDNENDDLDGFIITDDVDS